MEILHFEEAAPASYPELPVYWDEGSDFENIAPLRHLWSRIEKWICWRWSPRQCVWTVRGPGVWEPHLKPVSNLTVDKWDDSTYTWSAATPHASPLGGFCLPERATYKISGTVGDTQEAVPQLVVEAYQRLHGYYNEMQRDAAPAGSSSYSLNIGETLAEQIERSPNWKAKALQHSGAADLLRSFR